MEYLKRLPKQVPEGKVLVHNSVRPSRYGGNRGARFWLQLPDDRLELCDCGWAAELGPHWIVRSHSADCLPAV